MEHYSIVIESEGGVTLLRVGFGKPAQNNQIVAEVDAFMRSPANTIPGGALCLINGAASLPVAAVLSHHLVHRFCELAVFDPKTTSYVIVSSHGGRAVGDTITAGPDGYPL
jgi:hypothetical protein